MATLENNQLDLTPDIKVKQLTYGTKIYSTPKLSGILGTLAEGLALTEVTYSQLVELAQTEKLVPGKQYKIVDYVATTNKDAQYSTTRKSGKRRKALKAFNGNDYNGNVPTQPGVIDIQEVQYKSANKPFNIIVVADTTTTLNEYARCCKAPVDDEHIDLFDGCALEAWEIKYSLYNDTRRFAWADDTNGKGVIYWMKDEYGNEAGYDFKGIQVSLYGDVENTPYFYTFSFLQLRYSQNSSDPSLYDIDILVHDDTGKFVPDLTDNPSERPRNNKIAPYIGSDGAQYINGITFIRVPEYENPATDMINQIASVPRGSSFNTFGENCAMITVYQDYAEYNTFGKSCAYILLNIPESDYYAEQSAPSVRYGAGRNTFGDGCQYICADTGFYDNTIDAMSTSLRFDYDCRNNNIGYGNTDIHLNHECCYITTFANVWECSFSKRCTKITILNDNHAITVGENGTSIYVAESMNDYSDGITIGNNCERIRIGSKSYVIKIGDSATDIDIGSNCSNVTIDNNCSVIEIGSYCGGFIADDIHVFENNARVQIDDWCQLIQTAANCSLITIHRSCENVKLLKPKFTSVVVEQNNKGILIDSNASSVVYTKNIEVKQATNYRSNNDQAVTLLVDDANGNQKYLTTFANTANITKNVDVT